MFPTNQVNIMPVNDAYGAVVSGMDRINMEFVMIAGAIKKWDGKLVGNDLDCIKNRPVQSREGIYERAGIKPWIL